MKTFLVDMKIHVQTKEEQKNFLKFFKEYKSPITSCDCYTLEIKLEDIQK